MARTRTQRLKSAQDALVEEYSEGHENGLAHGIHVAERILAWWSTNHQLKVPYSNEVLTEWSQNAIKELRVLRDALSQSRKESQSCLNA